MEIEKGKKLDSLRQGLWCGLVCELVLRFEGDFIRTIAKYVAVMALRDGRMKADDDDDV